MRVINCLIAASCQKSPSFFFSFFLWLPFTQHTAQCTVLKMCVCVRDKLFLLLLIPSPSVFLLSYCVTQGESNINIPFHEAFVFLDPSRRTHFHPLRLSHTSCHNKSLFWRPYDFIHGECVWHKRRSTSALLALFDSDSSTPNLKCYRIETLIKPLWLLKRLTKIDNSFFVRLKFEEWSQRKLRDDRTLSSEICYHIRFVWLCHHFPKAHARIMSTKSHIDKGVFQT